MELEDDVDKVSHWNLIMKIFSKVQIFFPGKL